MNPSFKFIRIASICLLSAVAFGAAEEPSEHPPSVAPDAALTKLKEGNARFVSSQVSSGKPNAAKRQETVAARIANEIEVGDLKKSIKVISAVYNFDSGKVEWAKD